MDTGNREFDYEEVSELVYLMIIYDRASHSQDLVAFLLLFNKIR